MEKRDYLKDQIDQMGKVLAKILADFLGLKSRGNTTEGIEISNEKLKSQLDIDMETVASLSKEDLKDYLNERNATAEHLEIFSKYLQEAGESLIQSDNKQAKNKLVKALEVLEIADEISKTMSFSRMSQKGKIEDLIRQCG